MTYRSIPSSYLLRGLVVLGAALAIAAPIDGQAVVRFGRGSASLSLPVQLEVPVSLKVSAAGSERVVERTATYTELELPVRIAANLGWSLTVTLGATSELGPVLLRSADGDWLELGSTVPRTAIRSAEPANAIEVRIRLRVPAGMESTAALRLRLSLVPAELAGF